jgi:hypothetical protein
MERRSIGTRCTTARIFTPYCEAFGPSQLSDHSCVIVPGSPPASGSRMHNPAGRAYTCAGAEANRSRKTLVRQP